MSSSEDEGAALDISKWAPRQNSRTNKPPVRPAAPVEEEEEDESIIIEEDEEEDEDEPIVIEQDDEEDEEDTPEELEEARDDGEEEEDQEPPRISIIDHGQSESNDSFSINDIEDPLDHIHIEDAAPSSATPALDDQLRVIIETSTPPVDCIDATRGWNVVRRVVEELHGQHLTYLVEFNDMHKETVSCSFHSGLSIPADCPLSYSPLTPVDLRFIHLPSSYPHPSAISSSLHSRSPI